MYLVGEPAIAVLVEEDEDDVDDVVGELHAGDGLGHVPHGVPLDGGACETGGAKFMGNARNLLL